MFEFINKVIKTNHLHIYLNTIVISIYLISVFNPEIVRVFLRGVDDIFSNYPSHTLSNPEYSFWIAIYFLFSYIITTLLIIFFFLGLLDAINYIFLNTEAFISVQVTINHLLILSNLKFLSILAFLTIIRSFHLDQQAMLVISNENFVPNRLFFQASFLLDLGATVLIISSLFIEKRNQGI